MSFTCHLLWTNSTTFTLFSRQWCGSLWWRLECARWSHIRAKCSLRTASGRAFCTTEKHLITVAHKSENKARRAAVIPCIRGRMRLGSVTAAAAKMVEMPQDATSETRKSSKKKIASAIRIGSEVLCLADESREKSEDEKKFAASRAKRELVYCSTLANYSKRRSRGRKKKKRKLQLLASILLKTLFFPCYPPLVILLCAI